MRKQKQHFVEWGHWGIGFYSIGKLQHYERFPVGCQGPCDAGALRPKYLEMVRLWMDCKAIPGINFPFPVIPPETAH